MDMERAPLWAKHKETVASRRSDNIDEKILLSAFFLFCVKYTFDSSEILKHNEIVDLVLTNSTIALSIIKIVCQRYSLLRLFLTVTAALVIGVSCLFGGNYLFLNGFLFILAMQDVEFEKIIRLSFWFKTVSITIHVLWYIVLYLVNPSAISFVYRVSGVPRHYFLIGHANMFMAFLIWACFEYIYLHYDRLKASHMATIWIVNLIFYAFTDSNTGVVVLAAGTVLIALDKLGRGFFDKALTFLAKYTYLICAGVCSFLVIIYTQLSQAQKIIWQAIDASLTGRLWFGAYAYDLYGITFMGRKMNTPEKVFWGGRWLDGFAYFDNYYLGNLLGFGIIHLVLTAIAFIVIGNSLENKEKIMLIAFSFYAIMEAYVSNVFICFVLLIIGKYLYKIKRPAKAPEMNAPLYEGGGN